MVDDGSRDDTEAVVNRLGSSRVKYIGHEANRGYSAACNTAIREASGDYAGFLDSDDLWKLKYLKRVSGVLDWHPELGECSPIPRPRTRTNPEVQISGLHRCWSA